NNVFARDRLQGFLAAEGLGAAHPFTHWASLWGPVGEQSPLLIDAGPVKAFQPDLPTLEQLALPANLRVEPTRGADLLRLGLIRKK
ncbi:MAG: hypothetical protein NZO58_14785, partial [Gemmataceae bacterium]|nr:hypothetical protein [Gemmataceae bacterium]